MIWYGLMPEGRRLSLPLLFCLAIAAAMGIGLWVSALNVKYRDVRYVVPFLAQFGLYISDVGFRSSIVPVQWRLFYSVIPMVGVLAGFRWAKVGRAACRDGGCQ